MCVWLCSCASLQNLVTHHVLRESVSWQVFNVLVLCINDLCEFPAVHQLLKHPHLHCRVELRAPPCVQPDDLSNGRTPKKREREITLFEFVCIVSHCQVHVALVSVSSSEVGVAMVCVCLSEIGVVWVSAILSEVGRRLRVS